MAWHLNRALTTLRAEVDARWPGRDRASDGTIGDAAHAASTSDHNPDPDGTVDAWDMDKDGVDPWAVIEAFERHEAARYWIYNRQIATRDNGWRRERYFGDNPHDKHVHFNTRDGFQHSTKPYGVFPPEDDMQLTDTIHWRTNGVVKYSAPTSTVEGALTSTHYYLLATRDTLFRELAAARLRDEAILAAVQGGGSAEILARIDALAQAEADRAAAEQARDADLRLLVAQSQSGQLAAEEFVRHVADLFADAAGPDDPDS